VSEKVRKAAKAHHVKALKLKLSVSAKTTGLKAAKRSRTVTVRL
jgi:hypothetical protein